MQYGILRGQTYIWGKAKIYYLYNKYNNSENFRGQDCCLGGEAPLIAGL